MEHPERCVEFSAASALALLRYQRLGIDLRGVDAQLSRLRNSLLHRHGGGHSDAAHAGCGRLWPAAFPGTADPVGPRHDRDRDDVYDGDRRLSPHVDVYVENDAIRQHIPGHRNGRELPDRRQLHVHPA